MFIRYALAGTPAQVEMEWAALVAQLAQADPPTLIDEGRRVTLLVRPPGSPCPEPAALVARIAGSGQPELTIACQDEAWPAVEAEVERALAGLKAKGLLGERLSSDFAGEPIWGPVHASARDLRALISWLNRQPNAAPQYQLTPPDMEAPVVVLRSARGAPLGRRCGWLRFYHGIGDTLEPVLQAWAEARAEHEAKLERLRLAIEAQGWFERAPQARPRPPRQPPGIYVPTRSRERERWVRAWGIIRKTSKDYASREDWETDGKRATNADLLEALQQEMGYSITERTLDKIKRAGEAGLLKREKKEK